MWQTVEYKIIGTICIYHKFYLSPCIHTFHSYEGENVKPKHQTKHCTGDKICRICEKIILQLLGGCMNQFVVQWKSEDLKNYLCLKCRDKKSFISFRIFPSNLVLQNPQTHQISKYLCGSVLQPSCHLITFTNKNFAKGKICTQLNGWNGLFWMGTLLSFNFFGNGILFIYDLMQIGTELWFLFMVWIVQLFPANGTNIIKLCGNKSSLH